MSFGNSQESFLPLIESDDVPKLIAKHYAFTAHDVKELQGYSDKNFFLQEVLQEASSRNIRDNSHKEFLLKVTNLEDSKNVAWIGEQTAVMRHLSESGVACCKPIQSINGKYQLSVDMEKYKEGTRQHGTYIVRLFSYVKGQMMSSFPGLTRSTLLCRLGIFLADVHRHFEHFTSNYSKEIDDYEWNLIQVVDSLPSKLYLLDDHKFRLAKNVIDEFRKTVLSKCKELKQGVIHGDFSPDNIVVIDNKTLGVIDFGDSIHSYILFDIAIAVAHTMLYDNEHYMDVASKIINGYTSVIKLPTWELRLLRTCVQARLVQLLVLCYHRHMEKPCDVEYVLKAERLGGWKLVESLQNISEDEWIKYLDLIQTT